MSDVTKTFIAEYQKAEEAWAAGRLTPEDLERHREAAMRAVGEDTEMGEPFAMLAQKLAVFPKGPPRGRS